MNARALLAWVLSLCLLIPASPALSKPIDTKRFDQAERYMTLFSNKEYKKAYELLAWKISYQEYLARIEASNKAFAKELEEKGIELTSRKIERVSPMTFEDKYIIVAVESSVTGKRKGTKEVVKETVNYQVYFRFNEKGQIDLVNGIGEGWMC